MIKETIIAALKASGYDTFTACEMATAKVVELRNAKPGKYTFIAGHRVITVRKG